MTSTSSPDEPDLESLPARDEAPAEPKPRLKGRWFVFAVVLLADVMDLVDSTVTNVGGVSIREDIGGGESLLQWVGSAYTLAFAVLLITGARLGDLYGRRRLFLIGAGGFTVASALCAAAWSPESLIATRVMQASFGALMIPQGFGMLKEIFQDDEMGTVFAIFGPVMGLSAIAGPLVGGGLIELDLFGAGWRSIFFINVPLGLIAFFGAARFMPKTVISPGAGLDLRGMGLVGLAALALIYPLIEGREKDWPAWTFAMFGAGVALSVLFVLYTRRQTRQEKPVLIDLALMKNKAFTSGIVLAVGFFAAVAGFMLVVSLFWQIGEGYSPIKTAVALVPMSLGMVIGMILSFALVEKLGRMLVQLGIVIVGVALVGLALTVDGATHPSAWSLVPAVGAAGIGMGFVFGQLFDVTLASVNEAEVGSASGLLNAVQQLSFSVGVAAVGTVFFNVLDEPPHIPTDALATTALVSLVPLVISFGLAFRLPPKPRPEGAH